MVYQALNDYPKTASFSALWISTDERLSDFYTSAWQRGESPMPLLIVRLLLAAFALAILTWSLIENANPYWLLYLTSWGMLLVAAMMMSGIIVSFAFVCRKPTETSVLPWYVSLYWGIFNVTVTMSATINALYWLLLHNPALQNEMGMRDFWLNIATHAFTSCIVVAELLISRTPIRLGHIYQPLCFGVLYGLFTIIYYIAGGTDINGNEFIYDVLNWQYPKRSSILLISSVAFLIILYFLLWSLALIRDKCSMALVRTHSLPLPEPNLLAL
ncbi:unnamed protein product [Arctia plantaginis]|uniref:Protein rolling stone n=1 Tax=Arctia plantaginis TaxID=874455 RepID=A0A8S1A4U8_ARCPL|nr:unnamed protein product [Arctia plantaginis]